MSWPHTLCCVMSTSATQPLAVLAYEPPRDSQRDVRPVLRWIFIGGVIYGLAGFVSNFTTLFTRLTNAGNPAQRVWTGLDWQYFVQGVVALLSGRS